MTKKIDSLQNKLIKDLVLYKEKSRARRRSGLFLVEGRREIKLAVKGGYEIEYLIFNPEITAEAVCSELEPDSNKWIAVSDAVYHRLAYREGTQGVIAVAKARQFQLDELEFNNENPLVLVAEAPEKPGNIGALLRTADAASVDAVIIANPITDMFNPNIVRSSVGCLFTNPIATGSTDEVISFLKNKGIAIYCAALQASVNYTEVDFKKGSAIVLGTEADGLSKEWLQASDSNIIIPMHGEIDSLNVSVAAGIVIFEAKRQRGFN